MYLLSMTTLKKKLRQKTLLKEEKSSRQIALSPQETRSHSFILVSHCFPVNPGAQEHVKANGSSVTSVPSTSVQLPSLKHGELSHPSAVRH